MLPLDGDGDHTRTSAGLFRQQQQQHNSMPMINLR